ncbi:MAG TPA: PEGA domain-containing protein [Polyangia bacterium]
MRRLALVVTAVLLHAGAAAAGPRLVVWLPEGGPAVAGPLARALSWADGPVLLDPARLAERFPPSPAATARVAAEARVEAALAAAEKAFVETRFAAAARDLAAASAQLDALPPSARSHAAWVKAQLLTGRVDLAQGRPEAAAQAFAAAAGVAPEAQLDEGEYPPEVCRAYQAARQRVLALPPRALRVRTEPPGAEVELNGRLWGRTPATLKLPPGRCRLLISHPGFTPVVTPCGAGPELALRLAPADEATRRDVLRERLAGDPRWFLEPTLLDALAAETGVRWVLVLERGRGEVLEARLYWALKHAFRPLVPARFGAADLGELGALVQAAVSAAEGLEVRLLDPLTRAPVVDARAGDPQAIARAALFVRRKGAGVYVGVDLEPRAPGRFERALPADLLGLPGAAIELEYFVVGYDAGGEVRSRVGAAATPLRFTRAALPLVSGGPAPPPGPPPWYGRWYVWVGVAAVLAGATVGTYYAARSTGVGVVY